MPVTVTGARGTLNLNQTIRDIDMADAVTLLQPDAAPLTTLTKMIAKKSASDPKFQWAEDDLDPRFDVTAATATNVATSLTVTNGSYFAANDLVRITRTGEVVLVTAVAANVLTIVRGVGQSGTGQAVNNGDEIVVIGSAQPEGDVSKVSRSGNPAVAFNYTQIIRRPWESTRTARQTTIRTRPADWNYTAKKVGIEHKKDIELPFLMGRRDEITTGSQPRRTTGGAYSFIATNITDAGGTFTDAELTGAMRPAFRYGSKVKTAFCSALAVDVVNAFPRGKLEFIQSDNDQTYGLNVRTLISPHGTLRVVTHWLLEGAKFGGDMLILDLVGGPVEYRYLSSDLEGSSDSHIRENIQAPDADSRKDEYLAEVGLAFGQEKTHALITNITAAG